MSDTGKEWQWLESAKGRYWSDQKICDGIEAVCWNCFLIFSWKKLRYQFHEKILMDFPFYLLIFPIGLFSDQFGLSQLSLYNGDSIFFSIGLIFKHFAYPKFWRKNKSKGDKKINKCLTFRFSHKKNPSPRHIYEHNSMSNCKLVHSKIRNIENQCRQNYIGSIVLFYL